MAGRQVNRFALRRGLVYKTQVNGRAPLNSCVGPHVIVLNGGAEVELTRRIRRFPSKTKTPLHFLNESLAAFDLETQLQRNATMDYLRVFG